MMGPFLAGAIVGFAISGCVAVLLFTRKPRREISQWTDEHYQPPQAITKITVNRHRSFDI